MNVKCGCSTGFHSAVPCFCVRLLGRGFLLSAEVCGRKCRGEINADVIKPNRSFVDCTKTLFSVILAWTNKIMTRWLKKMCVVFWAGKEKLQTVVKAFLFSKHIFT
jgi:hypothetical protein